jgi:hypothetical protein
VTAPYYDTIVTSPRGPLTHMATENPRSCKPLRAQSPCACIRPLTTRPNHRRSAQAQAAAVGRVVLASAFAISGAIAGVVVGRMLGGGNDGRAAAAAATTAALGASSGGLGTRCSEAVSARPAASSAPGAARRQGAVARASEALTLPVLSFMALTLKAASAASSSSSSSPCDKGASTAGDASRPSQVSSSPSGKGATAAGQAGDASQPGPSRVSVRAICVFFVCGRL